VSTANPTEVLNAPSGSTPARHRNSDL
jgi:hypothetical protein